MISLAVPLNKIRLNSQTTQTSDFPARKLLWRIRINTEFRNWEWEWEWEREQEWMREIEIERVTVTAKEKWISLRFCSAQFLSCRTAQKINTTGTNCTVGNKLVPHLQFITIDQFIQLRSFTSRLSCVCVLCNVALPIWIPINRKHWIYGATCNFFSGFLRSKVCLLTMVVALRNYVNV